MNKEAIKAEIEKAKRQLAVAEKNNVVPAIAFAKKKIEKLEKDLEEAEKAPAPAPEKKEEPKKPAMPVKKAKVEKKEDKPKAKMPVKKEKPAKKTSKPDKKEKAAKEEKYVELDGKKYYESDKNFCEMLVRKWEGRRAAIKKANKKYKTKTISERIGGDIASAAIKTIDHVIDIKKDQIAKNPALYIAKFEKLADFANAFAKSIKELLGSEYDSSEVKAELEDIEKAIDKIKSKLKK